MVENGWRSHFKPIYHETQKLIVNLAVCLLDICRHIIVILQRYPVRKLYKSDIDWRLTWQDEFEKDGTPDPEKWVFSPWHPFCRDNNFVTFVKDGKLILRALPNSDPNDTIRYMAGCVETLGKKDFLYGRFEVCAKLGSAKGYSLLSGSSRLILQRMVRGPNVERSI